MMGKKGKNIRKCLINFLLFEAKKEHVKEDERTELALPSFSSVVVISITLTKEPSVITLFFKCINS